MDSMNVISKFDEKRDETPIPEISDSVVKSKIQTIAKKFNTVYSDNSWKPVNEFLKGVHEGALDTLIIIDSKYDSKYPHKSKTWEAVGEFKNPKGSIRACWVLITASGAGSTEDPLDKYDLTIQVETLSPTNLSGKAKEYFASLSENSNWRTADAITDQLDELASEIEPLDLRIALAIDQASDRLKIAGSK